MKSSTRGEPMTAAAFGDGNIVDIPTLPKGRMCSNVIRAAALSVLPLAKPRHPGMKYNIEEFISIRLDRPAAISNTTEGAQGIFMHVYLSAHACC